MMVLILVNSWQDKVDEGYTASFQCSSTRVQIWIWLSNMDGDSNDGTSTEALNGETKPDAAKLAQTAIIKQVSDLKT